MSPLSPREKQCETPVEGEEHRAISPAEPLIHKYPIGPKTVREWFGEKYLGHFRSPYPFSDFSSDIPFGPETLDKYIFNKRW